MTDYEVNFDFEDRAPDMIMNEDQFSIRWSGFVKVDAEGKYKFHALSDDGVRLWVGGQRVINNWGDHSARLDTGEIQLKEGYHPLCLEFYENGGSAVIRLYWSCDRFPMELIPPASLYHDPEAAEKARAQLR
jgi:hypothetical protein